MSENVETNGVRKKGAGIYKDENAKGAKRANSKTSAQQRIHHE